MNDKLNYGFTCGDAGADEKPGVDKAYYSAITVTQNTNGSNVLLHVPPIPNQFLDPNEFYIRVAVQIVNADGTNIPSVGGEPGVDVFPLTGFLNNLWSQVSVRLNGTVLPPTTDYPYVALLLSLLGTSSQAMDTAVRPLSYGIQDNDATSVITQEQSQNYPLAMAAIADSKEFVLYGRLHCGFLVTLAQLIPDTMSLDIELTRSRDTFPLGSANPNAEYRIKLNSFTLFTKRIEFNDKAHKVLRSLLSREQAFLKYQRYQSRVMYVPKDSRTFNWGNVFSGSSLPKRIFFMLVDQSSYSGAINRRPTFCETADVGEVRFLVDGRDILPEPYRPRFFKVGDSDKISRSSDIKSVILGLQIACGNYFEPVKQWPGMSTMEMIYGSMIYASRLPNYERDGAAAGTLDIAVVFNTNAHRSYTAICIGEFDQCLKISPNLDVSIL